jgi:hypothetical protein
MKALMKLCAVLLFLLFVLTACDLYNQINLGWTIDAVNVSSYNAHVDYTVWNHGKYDLTGVNLEIGVYATPTTIGYISAWTLPDFSLAQNDTRSGGIDINIYPNTASSGAAVLAVDMDNPKD